MIHCSKLNYLTVYKILKISSINVREHFFCRMGTSTFDTLSTFFSCILLHAITKVLNAGLKRIITVWV